MLKGQSITENFTQDNLLDWVDGFILDRQVRGYAKGTIKFYRQKLALFLKFIECEELDIGLVTQITPNLLRQYLLWLQDTGHNPGGTNAAYRAIRTFLYWWEREVEPENYKNPIRKVKAPKIRDEPLDPVEIQVVKTLINICEKGKFTGDRDRAIFLTLLDTGCRASEFLALDLEDIDPITGKVSVRDGKGGKPRSVFLGRTSRRAIRRYLSHREDENIALWINNRGERLKYGGIRSMVRRRANKANIEPPTLHSFRRAFAINSLRNGCNLFSLQQMMGHASLEMVKRYLKYTDRDIQKAHRASSPVDHSL